jgi:WD40 repeat protein
MLQDSTIIVWDIVNEAGMFRLNGHKGSITQLQFTIDGKFIISRYISSTNLLSFYISAQRIHLSNSGVLQQKVVSIH